MTPPAPERRLHAFAVDQLLGLAVVAAAVVVAPGAGAVAGLALLAAYAVGVGVLGTTPGHALLGLRVVDAATGAPVGVRRGALRTLLVVGAGLPTLGLGAASLARSVLVDAQRRGHHDHRCGTRVRDLRAAPGPVPVAQAPAPVVNLTALRLVPGDPGPPPAYDRPEREPLATGPWRVVLDSGEELAVDGPGLLGRDPEPRPGEEVAHLVPLRSADRSVSKTHARLHVAADGALVLTDRGSTNGSTLQRGGVVRPLPPRRPTTLLPGDVVRLGDRTLSVQRGA